MATVTLSEISTKFEFGQESQTEAIVPVDVKCNKMITRQQMIQALSNLQNIFWLKNHDNSVSETHERVNQHIMYSSRHTTKKYNLLNAFKFSDRENCISKIKSSISNFNVLLNTEYYINLQAPGTHRFVISWVDLGVGRVGYVFYTPDHYTTFYEIGLAQQGNHVVITLINILNTGKAIFL